MYKGKIRKTLKELFIKDEWKPIKLTWPWPEGYGVHNRKRNMVLDIQLTKEQAKERCNELNSEMRNGFRAIKA